jgi:hypothetical protein
MTRLRNALFLLALTLALPASTPAAVINPGGYILCSCELCSRSDVICRISPSGFSIECADYYAMYCQ